MACDKYKDDYKNVLYISNNPPHKLQTQLNNKFDINLYNNILKQSSVHKLTIHMLDNEYDNNTFYSHIIDEYYPK